MGKRPQAPGGPGPKPWGPGPQALETWPTGPWGLDPACSQDFNFLLRLKTMGPGLKTLGCYHNPQSVALDGFRKATVP